MSTSPIASLRPVVCVIDGLHTDRRTADDARRGRFTHAGVTLELGRTPDWIGGGLVHDEEWRIEWVKLYEGLHLAHAYGVTGDVEYLDTWQDLVESFCHTVPVGHDSSDVSARRVQNWLYAWQAFDAERMTLGQWRTGLAELLTERIAADVAHLRAHLTAERNHRTLELYTLLLAALALGEANDAANALELLAANATTDVWDDGVHRECSSDYHMIVLRSLVGAVANARAAGLDVPAGLVARADAAGDLALWLQRPDGTTPALSDGDEGDYRPLLSLAASVLDRPDLAWAASDGASGTAPSAIEATFPIGGYAFWRSGWSTDRPASDERWGVFDVGPIGDGGHGHYDQLAVEFVAGPTRLVVDPGRFTYADGPDGWRHWFKGTAAHNTVCVDGLDQIPYRSGKPKGERSEVRQLARSSATGIDVVTAEVRSPCYDAVHRRSVAFVDGTFWLVHDRLRAPTEHRYQVRWHLAAQPLAEVHADPIDGAVTFVTADAAIAVAAESALTHVELGWVAPSYGVRHAAPVVVTEVHGCDADLVTLVATAPAPRAMRATVGNGVAVELTTAAGADYSARWACDGSWCHVERTDP